MREVVAMTRSYRVSPFVRMGNLFVRAGVRSGLHIGKAWLLTVRGRKSGQPRTVPIAVIERDGSRYLVAGFGIVNWVQNIRAAGEATLTRGRLTERIVAHELAPEEAAPILKESIGFAPSFVRSHFDATPDSPLADFAREALRHPVFLITPLGVGERTLDVDDAAGRNAA